MLTDFDVRAPSCDQLDDLPLPSCELIATLYRHTISFCQGQPKSAPFSAVEKCTTWRAGRQSNDELAGR